tara:strand:+ start:12151 stop:13404 length:1254 start_codon:yes stop_codon:yes gene_type:complete
MSNSVNSTPGNPRIIQINTPGPQGPQGPAGSTTGSIDGDFKALNITSSGVISSSLVSTNYSLRAYSASFFYISASHLDLDSSSLSIGGEPWTQADVASLKAGKSLRQDQKQIVNENDTSTYVRMSSAGRAWHYASNKPLIKLQTSSFDLGSTDIPMVIQGSTLSITGSTSNTGSFDNSGSFSNEGSSSFTGSVDISGSCVVSGSFTVTDLLTVLANYGQTGSFGVSGSSEFTGDTNFDGAVTSQDLLNVLAGFGNTSGSNVDCSGSIDETYDNDILIFSSSKYSEFSNSGSFAQIKIRSGSSYHPSVNFSVMYTGSGTIDFELPPIYSLGPGFSYHIINKNNIIYQSEVTMSITPHSTDKFLYLPSGVTGSDGQSLLSYTPSGSAGIGNGSPFIKFTYGTSDGWSITELGGTWEQEA